MFFVEQGQFRYKAAENVLEQTPRPVPRVKVAPGVDKVKRGVAICESVLWTQWNHCGELTAVQDSVLLSMDSQKFGDIIVKHKASAAHAVKYARHFVWRLSNHRFSCFWGW